MTSRAQNEWKSSFIGKQLYFIVKIVGTEIFKEKVLLKISLLYEENPDEYSSGKGLNSVEVLVIVSR